MPQPDETRHSPDTPTARPGDATANVPVNTFAQTPDPVAALVEVPAGEFPSIPGYELRAKLGEGGMGVVYLARQRGLNRDVAVKTLVGATVSRATLARFWAEAEVMAEVRHPNVVQVIELGEHAGRPFMAMEFVKGGSLAARHRGGVRLPPAEAAELIEQVARGVAAAHDLGVVHRDLKPDNVLMDGETPKVADFGVAKRKSHALTNANVMLGTPAYMSPEQASSRSQHVGPAADVWSLGVMLYECLSGARPFDGDSVFDMLFKIATESPPPLHTRVGGVPRDARAIVAKCLAKDPADRYPTAKELAADLRRFLRGEPTAARPLGAAERVARWVRRKPTVAAAWAASALALGLALVVFVVVGSWRQAERDREKLEIAYGQLTDEQKETEKARDDATMQKGLANQERDKAVAQKGIADRARDDAERLKKDAEDAQAKEAAARRALQREQDKLKVFEYGHTIQLAHRDWRDNDVVGALALLEAAPPGLRGWEWRYVHRLCNAALLTLRGHAKPVHAAAFSADGARVVTASEDGTARVWEARTGAPGPALRGHRGAVNAAAFSPDGARVVTGGDDGTVRVWDAANGAERSGTKANLGRVTAAAFSPDGTYLLAAADQTVWVWDARTGAKVHALNEHRRAVNAAAFSPDGSRVVTGSDDGTVRVWDVKTGRGAVLAEHPGAVRAVAFSPDSASVVATGGPGHTAVVWNAQTGERVATLKGHQEPVLSAAFTPDGAHIITGSLDKTVAIWGARSGAPVATVRGHAQGVRAVACSADGQRVATASDDRTAKVWGANVAAEMTTVPKLAKLALAGWFRPPDVLSVSAATGEVVDAEAGTSRPVFLEGYNGPGSFATLSPNGLRVAARGANQTAGVWDARTGAKQLTLRGHTGDVVAAAFRADGARVVTAGDDAARVWDAKTGAELLALGGRTSSAAFSADGARVVTGGADGTGRVWDAETGAELVSLRGHAGPVRSVAFSPDGSRVVTGSDDGTARVWDAATGAAVLALKAHAGGVQWAAFSPDGVRLVTRGWPSRDDTTRIWDASPLDREFLPRPVAPPPRPLAR